MRGKTKYKSLLLGAVGGLISLGLYWKYGRKNGPSSPDPQTSIIKDPYLMNLGPIQPSQAREVLGPYFDYWPYIVAQAKHETGDLTSRLYKEQNNLFGMKVPNSRAFTGDDTKGTFMAYSDPLQSLKDLYFWFDYNSFYTGFGSMADYVGELKKKRYFEDSVSNYLNGMKRFV